MDSLPIACTLTRAELERDAQCLMPGLMRRAQTVTSLPEGVRLGFDASSDSLRDIVGVVDRERECCRFLQFELTVPPGGAPFSLTMTGPTGTREFFAAATALGAETNGDACR